MTIGLSGGMKAIDVIRSATTGDAAAIRAIYAPYVEKTAVSFEIDAPAIDEVEARINRTALAFPWLVYEADGAVIGYAYGSLHRERAAYCWSADSTVYIDSSFHRRGIGRALYQALAAVLDHQGYHYVFGGITLPNAGSVGLHEACGYTQVGLFKEVGYKFGVWHDVGWWGYRLNAPPTNPKPPQPFSPSMLNRALRLASPRR